MVGGWFLLRIVGYKISGKNLLRRAIQGKDNEKYLQIETEFNSG